MIGLAAGALCYTAVQLKRFFRYDDALDVIGVHTVAGVVGVMLTGAFASLAINPVGVVGGLGQLERQTLLTLVCLGYPFVLTFAIVALADKVVGLRVGRDEQREGLDLGELGEMSYDHSNSVLTDAGTPLARTRRPRHESEGSFADDSHIA